MGSPIDAPLYGTVRKTLNNYRETVYLFQQQINT